MKLNPITGIWIILILSSLVLLADVIFSVATSKPMAIANGVVGSIIVVLTILMLKQDTENPKSDGDYE